MTLKEKEKEKRLPLSLAASTPLYAFFRISLSMKLTGESSATVADGRASGGGRRRAAAGCDMTGSNVPFMSMATRFFFCFLSFSRSLDQHASIERDVVR
jgi:hypothetical protein